MIRSMLKVKGRFRSKTSSELERINDELDQMNDKLLEDKKAFLEKKKAESQTCKHATPDKDQKAATGQQTTLEKCPDASMEKSSDEPQTKGQDTLQKSQGTSAKKGQRVTAFKDANRSLSSSKQSLDKATRGRKAASRNVLREKDLERINEDLDMMDAKLKEVIDARKKKKEETQLKDLLVKAEVLLGSKDNIEELNTKLGTNRPQFIEGLNRLALLETANAKNQGAANFKQGHQKDEVTFQTDKFYQSLETDGDPLLEDHFQVKTKQDDQSDDDSLLVDYFDGSANQERQIEKVGKPEANGRQGWQTDDAKLLEDHAELKAEEEDQSDEDAKQEDQFDKKTQREDQNQPDEDRKPRDHADEDAKPEDRLD